MLTTVPCLARYGCVLSIKLPGKAEITYEEPAVHESPAAARDAACQQAIDANVFGYMSEAALSAGPADDSQGAKDRLVPRESSVNAAQSRPAVKRERGSDAAEDPQSPDPSDQGPQKVPRLPSTRLPGERRLFSIQDWLSGSPSARR